MTAPPHRDAKPAARAFPAGSLPWLAAGFCLWFSALVFVYALHHIGCLYGWSAGSLRWSLALALLVHIAAIGLLWHIERRRGANASAGRTGVFMHWIILGTLVAALAKIVFTLGPTLFLTVCL